MSLERFWKNIFLGIGNRGVRVFEWDEKKNLINIQKHGISFEEAVKLFDVSDVAIKAKNVDDESRYAIIGKLNDKCFFVSLL